ncbi:hypothetical protein A4A49_62431, partial [Nicotiana attenuata]
MQLKLTRDLENLSPNMRNLTPQAADGRLGKGISNMTTVLLVTVSPMETVCSHKENELNIMENKVIDNAKREITLKEQQLLNQKATKEAEQEKSKVVVGENQQKWSNLFRGNKMAARGMDLVFIPPTIQDGVKK